MDYFRTNLSRPIPTVHKAWCPTLDRANGHLWHGLRNVLQGEPTDEGLIAAIFNGKVKKHRLCKRCFGVEAYAVERWLKWES